MIIMKKNIGSFFISNCFKLLQKNIVLLSYADTNKNHHGYIYQATNWIYTGLGSIGTNEYVYKNKEIHQRHLKKTEFFNRLKLNYDDNLTMDENFKLIGGEIVKNKPKHRYIYILGDKKFKRKITDNFKLERLPYPKGDNKNYDTSYQPDIQQKMFQIQQVNKNIN